MVSITVAAVQEAAVAKGNALGGAARGGDASNGLLTKVIGRFFPHDTGFLPSSCLIV